MEDRSLLVGFIEPRHFSGDIFFLIYCLQCSDIRCFVHGYSVCELKLTLGPFAKLRNATISFIMAVSLHGTTGLSLGGFS